MPPDLRTQLDELQGRLAESPAGPLAQDVAELSRLGQTVTRAVEREFSALVADEEPNAA